MANEKRFEADFKRAQEILDKLPLEDKNSSAIYHPNVLLEDTPDLTAFIKKFDLNE